MALYDRVFTEGLQRERRRGKVTLGDLPENLRKTLEKYEIPRERAQFPGNWPTRVEWGRDPRLEYKIASHVVRSRKPPIMSGERTPEEFAQIIVPPLKSKTQKLKDLLYKRKLLQRKLRGERGED